VSGQICMTSSNARMSQWHYYIRCRPSSGTTSSWNFRRSCIPCPQMSRLTASSP